MNDDHRWSGFAASWVLGTAEQDEAAEFRAHMETCAACRAEVREMEKTAGLLAHAAPSSEPPPGLRDRILADARKVRPIAAAAPPVVDGPARSGTPAWVSAALAASVLLALVALVLYAAQLTRNEQLAGQLVSAQEEAGAFEARVARLDSLVQARDSLLDAVLDVGVRTGTLVSEGQPPSARMYWNRDRGVVVIAAWDLPPAPPGRTYQLWGIPAGQSPVSLGTFNSDADGNVAIALPVGSDLEFTIGAITEEPAGGSPQPTSTPFMVGPVVP